MTDDELFAVLEQALPGKAFKGLVQQGTPEPYLVFTRVSQTPQNDLCGYADADVMHYQIDSYAKTLTQAQGVMRTVLGLLRACPDPPLVYIEQDMYEQDTRIHRTMIDISTWYEPEQVTQ